MKLRWSILLIIGIFAVLKGFSYIPSWVSAAAFERAFPTLTQQDISREVLRLHIPANSNTYTDQKVKYEVRDALIDEFTHIARSAGSVEEAKLLAKKNLQRLNTAANTVLLKNHVSYSAHVELKRLYFPEKTYSSMIFPCGYYEAVQVTLGNGEGNNWWCVLYPPLCFLNIRQDEAAHYDENRPVEIRSKLHEILSRFF